MTLQQRASDKHATRGEHAHEQLNQPPSPRCEPGCSTAFCLLPIDERGRWWPDCPVWPCPDWKAAALGVVGLPDDEQRRVARLLAADDEQRQAIKATAYQAGAKVCADEGERIRRERGQARRGQR